MWWAVFFFGLLWLVAGVTGGRRRPAGRSSEWVDGACAALVMTGALLMVLAILGLAGRDLAAFFAGLWS